MVSADCSVLIAAGAKFHPLYGDRLSNHLPMALIALDRLGATREQLNSFASRYSQRLSLRDAPMPPRNPHDAMGARAELEGIHAFFIEQIARDGVADVLRTWLPALMSGVAASAFHALIRLGYAVDASDSSEAAVALAYWTSEYQSLGNISGTSNGSLHEIAHAAAMVGAGHKFGPGIIVDRMASIATEYASHLASAQPAAIDHRDIAQFAISVYASREDFTLLHLVTACHAFSNILPYVTDVPGASRYLWQAILIAYLSTGSPCTPMLQSHDVAIGTWDSCFQNARLSKDDHVIKLVYTAWIEYARTQDTRYLHVAWRKANSRS